MRGRANLKNYETEVCAKRKNGRSTLGIQKMSLFFANMNSLCNNIAWRALITAEYMQRYWAIKWSSYMHRLAKKKTLPEIRKAFTQMTALTIDHHQKHVLLIEDENDIRYATYSMLLYCWTHHFFLNKQRITWYPFVAHNASEAFLKFSCATSGAAKILF